MIDFNYYTRGTAELDGDQPAFASQGLEAFCIPFNTETETPFYAPMADGQLNLGYKGVQVHLEEYTMWKRRITNATPEGYTDEGGTWYPGKLGQGQSVVNAENWESLKAWRIRRDLDKMVVTRAQALQALLDNYGVTKDTIYTLIDRHLDPTTAERVRLWFNEALTFRRSNPDLLTLAPYLGLTSDDLDNIFIIAKRI